MKYKVIVLFVLFALVTGLLGGCGRSGTAAANDNYRTYYEIFPGSFYDSNGDGMGDLNGITQKLDYLNDGKGHGLGITGIWLMPILSSPSYHKYDVTDYFKVDPAYGTNRDFKKLASACHKRGIRLILDFEANHTSSQHPWFRSAVKTIEQNPDHPAANSYLKYYHFVKGQPSTGHYAKVGGTGWYYEDEFSTDMPDLNLDNPSVRKELARAAKYWLKQGADGFRLDAVLYYYGSDGVGDTDKNVAFVDWFTGQCRSIKQNAYIVGEVWANASTIAPYYTSKANSFFAFPFSQATGYFAATLNYSGSDYSAQNFARVMAEWQKMITGYDKNAIDAPFLSNHDMDRSVGYFDQNLVKTKMAAGLYLMMSGNPFIYYGEEIGMTGSGTDPNRRGPMYWSSGNQKGMTSGPAGMSGKSHFYPAEDVQSGDKNSLLNYYKKAIALRNANPEIARGKISVLSGIKDTTVCVVRKSWQGSSVILVYNISEKSKVLVLSKEKNDYSGLRGYLSASGSPAALKEDHITLPPMSIVVLR